MNNIELLQDALHAAEEAYIYLTSDEKDILNSDYAYYDNLNLLRRITDRIVADIRDKEQRIKELENSNEY